MKYIQSTYTAVTLAGILLNLSGMSVLLGTGSHHATTLEGQTAKSAAAWIVDRAARQPAVNNSVPASPESNEFDQVAARELQ